MHAFIFQKESVMISLKYSLNTCFSTKAFGIGLESVYLL